MWNQYHIRIYNPIILTTPPFEQIRDDLRDNYGVENPSQAIFNLFIQGSKHYDQFTSNVGELMQLEQDFMSRIVGGRVNNILDLNRVYVENPGADDPCGQVGLTP